MKYFTKAQIEEIAKALATLSVRDSDLDEVSQSIGEDYVAIARLGESKKISVDALKAEIGEGLQGESAYDIAKDHGYEGTEEQWLASLVGPMGVPGRGIATISEQLDINRNTVLTFAYTDGTTQTVTVYVTNYDSVIASNTRNISQNTSDINILKAKATAYVILDPNLSFVSQVVDEDTVYEVRDNFDLDDAEVVMPNNSVLFFNGGKISNGAVDASSATYEVEGLYQVFDNIEFGNNFFKHSEIIPEYVGAVGDGVTDDTEAMRQSVKIASLGRTRMRIPNGSGYLVSGPLNYYNESYRSSYINIIGCLPNRKSTNVSTKNYGWIKVADGACLFGFPVGEASTLYGSIANVAIFGERNLETNVFNYCSLSGFNMENCYVSNFGAFACDTSLKALSQIHDNHFTSVHYFSRVNVRPYISLIDSTIRDNYINGGANPQSIVLTNACFQFGEYNGATIRGNFIDYYRTIYEPLNNGTSSIACGHINAYGNHYQVFRYFYFMRSGISSMNLNSQHEYFNWTDPDVLDNMSSNPMPFVHRTYTGKDDGETHDYPEYITRTTSGSQNIVIENATLEKNIGNIIMFYGAPTSYKYSRYKLTIANWSDDFGSKYALPEGATDDKGNYCGGSFQYKEVETNFICNLDSLPTLTAGNYSSFPYGTKALYDGRIYKATRIRRNGAYVAIWIPEDVNSYVPESGATANRPTSPTVGEEYFDTTLGKPIWYKGSSVWVDASGDTV